MKLKKYSDFVKTNEEVMLDAPTAAEPVVKPQEPITKPKEPITRPTPPSIVPDYTESDMPSPAKAELPEEEGGEYVGQKMLAELAEKLGVEVGEDGSIDYNGKKINFYSETEMFHIDNKKFATVDEVVNYLETLVGDESKLSDVDEDEYEKGDMPFESKSYRNSRKRK